MARWLGIDIGDRAVRVAMVRSTFGRVTVEALREQLLADHETIESALRTAAAGLRTDGKSVAISGARSFLRRITLPKAAQRELASVLSFEVESTLPFELDDAVMDHRVLKPGPGDDPKTQLRILAGVAYTDAVRDRIELVRRATGTEPERVGLGPLPLANLALIVPELGTPAACALLELGTDHADVVVLRNGEPQFSRCLSRGVAGLPADAAALARELRQTMTRWRTQGGEPISRLYVVGSGRSIPGLDPFLAAQLGVEVIDLPKPSSIEGLSPEDAARLPEFAKALAVALSLSRRATDLNLRRGALETQQSFQFLREKTPLLAGLATAVLVSFGFSVYADLSALEAERTGLEDQLAAATQASFGEETRDPERGTELLERALAGKSDDPMPEMDAFGVMVELSKRVPKQMTHDVAEFDFNRGAVTIRGVVPSIDDAQAVSKAMAEHRCFQDVKITRTTKLSKEDKQKYALEFSVKCGADKKDKKKDKKDSGKPSGATKSPKGESR